MNLYPKRIVTADPIELGCEADVPFEELRRTGADLLAVVADGPCVWDDLEAFWELAEGIPFDVMCINEVATVFPCDFEHFAAGDSHMRDMQRIAAKIDKNVLKHGHNTSSYGFNIRWQRVYGGWSGTSTYFGMRVALAMDYLRIVLVGSPMTDQGHWYDDRIEDPTDERLRSKHSYHLWKWREFAARPYASFVRSMSGNTKAFLGEPTREWLLAAIPVAA